MATKKKLIHFKKGENYDIQKANGNILDSSICFIQDRRTIVTHGTEYKTVNWYVLEPELYEWIDLGLPSGTLWADKNVGAEKPEDFGLYFAWGETEGYSGITENKGFYWGDYKLCSGGSSDTLTKYNNNSLTGVVDNLTVLEQVDDAAYQVDNSCRMPTKSDFEELTTNTTGIWETLNGVNGRRFTSKTNGNSIFIPAAGICVEGFCRDIGSWGYLWSSSLYSNSRYAYTSYFYSGNVFIDNYYRNYGFSVRPVK